MGTSAVEFEDCMRLLAERLGHADRAGPLLPGERKAVAWVEERNLAVTSGLSIEIVTRNAVPPILFIKRRPGLPCLRRNHRDKPAAIFRV